MVTSMSHWIQGAKIVLISSGVVSIALATRLAVPLVVNFTVYELPTVWTVLMFLFRPLYLYVIIHVIIITIVATSLFAQSSDQYSRPLISARTPPPLQISAALPPQEAEETEALVVYEVEEEAAEVKKPVVVNELHVVDDDDEKVVHNDDEVAAWWASCTPPQEIITSRETETERNIFLPVTVEKPPVRSRSRRRRPLKAIPQGGKTEKAAEEERAETLESVWRKIHEVRRHAPQQPNAFENYGGRLEVVHVVNNNNNYKNRHVRKSETFKGRTKHGGGGDDGLELALAAVDKSPRKIRKEASLSQEELNRRAEAFIRKVNEEMRLQREASLKPYNNLVNLKN